MSNFLDEEVPPVNPLSITVIEELGRCFLEQLAPEMLEEPRSLDVLHLADTPLPKFGINVYPATRAEIGDMVGATDPIGDAEIDILVSEEIWDALEQPAPVSHYARSTVCHEVGHAVLHVPVLRRRLLHSNALPRMQRGKLKAYEDPEWQAWTFAGAILMPSEALRMLQAKYKVLTPEIVADVFEVSTKMARSYMRKLAWLNNGHG
jgi:hypothetical protein